MAKAKTVLTQNTLDDASTAEIIAFAQDVAGLKFEADASRAFVLDGIYDTLGWKREVIAEGVTHVKIKIAADDSPNGTQDVRVQGMYTIKRNVAVTVPVIVFNILQDINDDATILLDTPVGELKDETPVGNTVKRPVYSISVLETFSEKVAE